MRRGGSHAVISIRSVNRNGPTAVSQSKVVPTPEVLSEVNLIATASAIHSGCVSMRSTSAHTAAGGASMVTPTRSLAITSRYDA